MHVLERLRREPTQLDQKLVKDDDLLSTILRGRPGAELSHLSLLVSARPPLAMDTGVQSNPCSRELMAPCLQILKIRDGSGARDYEPWKRAAMRLPLAQNTLAE